MAQPTQAYPPWLTPVPETIFDTNGVPISTSTTILYLPLTYYGPSIPLGPYWTYGGLTPPVSTTIITTTTTVIPTTSLSTPTATPTSISTSTSTPASSPNVSSLPSPSPSPSSPATATPSHEHGPLSRNQLIGVIVGAVIGALVILLALFVCFLVFKNRRREQHIRFSNMPIEQDYILVEEDAHVPGDGSPRESGEEPDSLLQPHRAGPTSETAQPTIIPRSMPVAPPAAGPSQPAVPIPSELGARPGVPRVPVPVLSTYSSNNSGTSGSSTEMSSLGSIVPNSRLSALSPLVAEQREMQRAAATTHFRGAILSLEEQRRVEQETRSALAAVREEPRRESGLLPLPPPPRSTDTEGASPKQGSNQPQIRAVLIPQSHINTKNHYSYGSSNRSSAQSDLDEAALLTARRVKPVDWGVRPAPYYYSPLSERQNATSSGGILSSISNRLSWFKNLDALPLSGSTRRRSVTPKSIKVSEKDSEANRALLSPTSDSSDPHSPTLSYYDNPSQTQLAGAEHSQYSVRPRPNVRVGLGPEGKRPISGVSGRSGASSGAATTYYDAYSTFPNTPVLTPLPRAMKPVAGSLAGQSSRESNWRLPSPLTAGASTTSLHGGTQRTPVEFGGRADEAPPAYDENDTIAREHARDLASRRQGVDVLDLPAPSPLTTFRNTAVGAIPMNMMASTSTTLSNTNTVTSTTAPTLFTHTEVTLSTATSESSLRNQPSRAADSKPDSPGGNGGAGTVANINMVHVPQTGTSVFAVKESGSWSDQPTSGNNYATQEERSSHYRDASSSPHFSSKETNRSNMTGTTLAGEEKAGVPGSTDLLEDEPPAPGEGWRNLSSIVGGGSAAVPLYSPERRFTLGWQLPQREITLAELGSLQAMRSHLSPVSSNRSTGSAPASRRDASGSTGSRSSRPSAQQSLTHSGSISSSEGRRWHPSLRYSVYTGREGSSGSSNNAGNVSPALSAFGNRIRKQPSDEKSRNLTPLSEQYGTEVGPSYRTAPSTMGSRHAVVTQDTVNTFRTAMSAQSTGAAPALMEIEEDVVEAAMRASSNSNSDRELGLLSPRSQTSDLSATFSVSNVPWATGLDQNWRPL